MKGSRKYWREFDVEFEGPVGRRKGLLLRKQVKEVVRKELKVWSSKQV